jgi:hypothetical protein
MRSRPRLLGSSLAFATLSALAGCDDPAPSAPADAATADAPDASIVPYAGPDDWCPGRDHCMGTSGDNVLHAGFARAVINPMLTETMWEDRNNNGHFDMGEAFTDVNGNGMFDAYWIAGFGNGRPARGVNDDLEVRAMAFRYNDTSVAFAVIDCVGLFNTEMDRIRAEPLVRALDLDKVIVASTHVHEGPDTIGLWGRTLGQSGIRPEYLALIRTRAAEAIRDAVMALRPARMRVAQVVTADAMGSTQDYVNDTRDPVIYDPTVTLVQFTDASDRARTLGTWVNWAAHPEYTGSRNNLLSADYVHALRETIERGITGGVQGLGGTTVFVNGALGGQVGPNGGVHPRNDDGTTLAEAGIPRAQLLGRNVARLALQALARDGTDIEGTTPLSYRTAPLSARVENTGYALYFNSGVFDRELFGHDTSRPLGRTNFAWVRSRVTYLQVGPVATVTAPGELHPELWVGTRDLRWSWGRPVLTETENRPDLATAPAPPYLRDLMLENPGVRWATVSGLSEDFLGYIVAAFNYVVHTSVPYIVEAAGDHYEETNSIGPEVERFLQHPMMAVARWRPPAQ